MKLRSAVAILLVAVGAVAGSLDAYTFLFWADGWHYRSPEGRRILHIQTSGYAAAFDVEKPDVVHLGPIAGAAPYAEAVAQPNTVITDLPASKLRLAATVDGVTYTCTEAALKQDDEANFPVRIIESGRFLQRFDILNLKFESGDGTVLDADARLEVIAWPDRLSLLLDVTPKHEVASATLESQLGGGTPERREFARAIAAGETIRVPLLWQPSAGKNAAPEGAEQVMVTDVRGDNTPVPVQWDVDRSWYYVDLPERSWDIAAEPDRLDRFGVRLVNDGDSPRTYHLLFAFDESFPGVTGMCPMLRDRDGQPTGIPIQISKNWHRQPDRRFLYEGPWFHGATMITVPPHETWEGECAIAYARWGGVPAAAHAQLCLIGWGTNQLWDQASIGSWGESITYDPDVNLTRSMIDDVRPLMVTGMNGNPWEWAHNVGGGDFLVYMDPNGKRQRLTRMKTAYLSQGPNLTDVVYAGVSGDGHIEARIEVCTPRCDDVNRAYHRVRYDVRKPTPFSRLAFYQLGADNYNDHQFTTIARGNAAGLTEEWPAVQGGKQYSRTGIACEGVAPWFSLHGGFRSEQWKNGAWANRGLVVRSWNARLGGIDTPSPIAAVYGTENGVPSANVELTAPAEINELLPGDFVEFEVELLIVPVAAAEYYGPNEAFRAHLAENAGTWSVIHRLAKQNNFEIHMTKGTLVRTLPIEVNVDASESAEFEVTDGAGYIPITVTGLRGAAGYVLSCNEKPVDQSVHWNDFWQTRYDDATKTFSRTYNLSFDGDDPKIIRFAPKR